MFIRLEATFPASKDIPIQLIRFATCWTRLRSIPSINNPMFKTALHGFIGNVEPYSPKQHTIKSPILQIEAVTKLLTNALLVNWVIEFCNKLIM